MISYSWKDEQVRDRLEKAIKTLSGVATIVDKDNIRPSDKIHEKMDGMVDSADAIVAILSKEGRNSGEVHYELNRARMRNLPILAIVEPDVGPEPLPFFLNDTLCIRPLSPVAPWQRRSAPAWVKQLLGKLNELSSAQLGYENGGVVSWHHVIQYVDKLVDAFKAKEYRPEVLVSFPSGGLIVADLIGARFENKLNIVSVHTTRIPPVAGGEWRVQINDEAVNYSVLKGKKILLVDDVLETGLTIATIKSALEPHSRDITIACLGKTKRARQRRLEPHFSAFEYHFASDQQMLDLPWGRVRWNDG
jgi:hypoxanthine phosphoribosyltransferase